VKKKKGNQRGQQGRGKARKESEIKKTRKREKKEFQAGEKGRARKEIRRIFQGAESAANDCCARR